MFDSPVSPGRSPGSSYPNLTALRGRALEGRVVAWWRGEGPLAPRAGVLDQVHGGSGAPLPLLPHSSCVVHLQVGRLEKLAESCRALRPWP